MENKKKINLVVANNTNPGDYIAFLNLIFDVNLITHEQLFDRKNLGLPKIDLMLFTGGEDVNPDFYIEPKGKYTSINKERDAKEQKMFNNFKGVPKLGICRGSQFLTVMNGGELVQHVNNHTTSHEISVSGMGTFQITSTHHQMMFPFNLPKDKYELIGWSTYFRSNTYLNGWNTEKELPKDFLEPEIVFYPKTNSLCIQGHPEMRSCGADMKEIALKLINNYLIK